MECIQRFPKWLTEEEFDLHYCPSEAHPYMVTLYGKTGRQPASEVGITASADTIGQAAKQAYELREEARRSQSVS